MDTKKVIALTIGTILVVFVLRDVLFVYNFSLWTAAQVQAEKPVEQQQLENMYMLMEVCRPVVIGWACLSIGPALLIYARNEVQPFSVSKIFFIVLTIVLGAIYVTLLHSVMSTNLPSQGNPFEDKILLNYMMAFIGTVCLGFTFPFLAKRIS